MKVGLLNAYRQEKNAPDYQLAYGPMFLDFLAGALPGYDVRMFEVATGEFPSGPGECDAWIITGSPKEAYGDEPWIRKLGQFVQDAHAARKKLIGVCFGHQLIAHYLGGKTENSPSGWGVGVRTFKIKKSKPWMNPPLEQVSLLFSHQDQVVRLPDGAEWLGEDEFCRYQMYSLGGNVFCLQGHPEFTAQFAKDRLDSRVERVGPERYKTAVQSLGRKTHSAELGQWMRAFLELA